MAPTGNPAPSPGQPPLQRYSNPGFPPPHQGILGNVSLGHGAENAAMLRALGDPAAAARLWISRHPYAMTHGGVPGWVQGQEPFNGIDGDVFGNGQHAGLGGTVPNPGYSPSQPSPQDIVSAAAGSLPPGQGQGPAAPSGQGLAGQGNAVAPNAVERTSSVLNSLRGGHLQALLQALGHSAPAHSGMVPY